jgi:hypothetical protein
MCGRNVKNKIKIARIENRTAIFFVGTVKDKN